MINQAFESIAKNHIDALISNEVPENKTLDYKEVLPGNSDNEKSEFLEDVSSFANAVGGDIVFGIRERRAVDGRPTGTPEAAIGLPELNADAEILRLENIIRDGIARRIPSVRIKAVLGFEKGPVLVMRIGKSWVLPHMITFKKRSPFYSRNNAGKYPMDVSEIRSAFALSESLPEKIRKFRDERISKIIADDTPVTLLDTPKIVLHVLPIAALEPSTQIDIRTLENRLSDLRPLYSNGWDHRFNFDGFVTFTKHEDTGMCGTYLQVFRSGAVEAVEARLLEPSGSRKNISSVIFEREIMAGLQRALQLLRNLEFEPPVFVMLTLYGVKGYTIGGERFRPSDNQPIDRDLLLLPDIIVEDYSSKADKLLLPAFDAVWQAAGWACSYNYDENGNWTGGKPR